MGDSCLETCSENDRGVPKNGLGLDRESPVAPTWCYIRCYITPGISGNEREKRSRAER